MTSERISRVLNDLDADESIKKEIYTLLSVDTTSKCLLPEKEEPRDPSSVYKQKRKDKTLTCLSPLPPESDATLHAASLAIQSEMTVLNEAVATLSSVSLKRKELLEVQCYNVEKTAQQLERSFQELCRATVYQKPPQEALRAQATHVCNKLELSYKTCLNLQHKLDAEKKHVVKNSDKLTQAKYHLIRCQLDEIYLETVLSGDDDVLQDSDDLSSVTLEVEQLLRDAPTVLSHNLSHTLLAPLEAKRRAQWHQIERLLSEQGEKIVETSERGRLYTQISDALKKHEQEAEIFLYKTLGDVALTNQESLYPMCLADNLSSSRSISDAKPDSEKHLHVTRGGKNLQRFIWSLVTITHKYTQILRIASEQS